MIIGINSSYIAAKNKTGIENFSSQLIFSLLKYDKENKFFLFSSRSIDKAVLPNTKNYNLYISPFPKGWHTFRLPLSLIRHKVNIFLDPGYTIPPFISIPSIVFVHDLAFKYFPEAYSLKQLKNLHRSFLIAQSKASAIIFSSENTQRDFEKYYPNSRAVKKTIYIGHSEEFSTILSRGRRDILKLSDKYLLFVGRIEMKKNISNLIRAYVRLRHSHPDIRHKLVLAGEPGFGYENIKREIASVAKFKTDIIETGYIKDKDLPHLYASADVFVYPSLYEGFGIPLLEAFAARVPIIASSVSSIPEVGDNAMSYFDPSNPEDIYKSMFEMISNRSKRKNFVSRGLNRLKFFTWEKYCHDLSSIINNIVVTK